MSAPVDEASVTPLHYILTLSDRSFDGSLIWAGRVLDAQISDDDVLKAREALNITPIERPDIVDCAALIYKINLRNQRANNGLAFFRLLLNQPFETREDRANSYDRCFKALTELTQTEKFSYSELKETALLARDFFEGSRAALYMSPFEHETTLMILFRDAGMAEPAWRSAKKVMAGAGNDEIARGLALHILHSIQQCQCHPAPAGTV